MINAIIIEDEKPAIEKLANLLSKVSMKVNIKARLHSVKDSIEFLSKEPDVNLIFSDVLLPDGLAFNIFSAAAIKIPVIFITGYDYYMMNAFENNGIDYLLKPVDINDLQKAVSKYDTLQSHFLNTKAHSPIESLTRFLNPRKKTRLVAKRGLENIALLLEDVVLIYTQDKLVYVIDRLSKKYLVDKTLAELEKELDEHTFFRANRQYFININYVRSFKAIDKVKLLVDINIPEINHPIIISQETAPAFRRWMNDA